MDFNTVLMKIQNKLPKDVLVLNTLRDKFNSLSTTRQEQVVKNIATLQLKSPSLVFWVGSFLFGNLGVGRFMIGDKGLGITRLVIFILSILCIIFSMSLAINELTNSLNDESYEVGAGTGMAAVLAIFGYILIIVANIWWIVDLFLVGKKLRRQNYQTVLNSIN